MEVARTEGDELIADYVNCLMSLDANSRPVENINPSSLSVSAAAQIQTNIPSVLHEQSVPKVFVQAGVEETDLEPVLGMEFESDEAAKTFYNEYARRLGFPFRVGRSRRSKGTEEVLIMKRFVCSKEGIYQKKPSSEGTRKRERMSMREGCKAMMEVIRDNERWVVSKLEKAHNHHLGTCTRVGYLRSRGFINASDKANFIASDTMMLLRQNAFGQGGDAQGLLDYFKRMQAENPAFFYAIQVDNNSCVSNAFWADAKARTSYNYFGDTVTFDTTYKKNKYMMPFITFSGVNHHLQPVIFGYALLIDENEYSFIWLFETWLEAMGGRRPVSFVTDQNRAMAAATAKVFPETCHRFCKWLILSRSKQKLAHVYSAHPTLKAELEKCVNESESIRSFETNWASMIDKFDLMKNTWLQGLFNIRQKWVPVYLKDNFFAEMSPTQKLETMNDFYKKHFNTKTSLKVLLTQFELAMASRYEDEVEAELDTICTSPILKTASPIEKQAALIYTRTVFEKFQEEFVESFGCHVYKVKDGAVSKFNVTRDDDALETFTITYNAAKSMATCSCKHFEFSGILCRHIIAVFLMVDVRILPEEYFLRRWTRSAMRGSLLDEDFDNNQVACQASVSSRFNDLCRDAIKFAEKGAKSTEMYRVVKAALQKVFTEIIASDKTVSTGAHRDAININEEIPIDDAMNDQSLQDPERKVTNFLGQLLGSSWSPM
ncbi:protein FAR1-RELATED SEQUENCE 9 isoform X1 [Dendrobium catenatum]|uniref:Protein FAR1-RELATED SEQUENCE n=1 Tax=Dendrobium catenatum TaxID=906689 RepID=A0A2I0X6N2_9ASPA|nr:protein FAR1-RELATED SEQUENCE 9 isoform X1 [Dendrobium catenatum]XP_020692281.1 protein FAR1-RELATED SEQUENCE 9 isoform X1 [Dendrobium catenatum]XP_020692287.1 protein FAR1-RELATED SEQUENCE 9 isoform X1 [Dendrobium catenatum]XP_020692296.1 protein FAR1-RELATED SEQUENCE 9 isoform X1 [Dendrobium catenatum]PKU83569.1 Protein FAR1-RELATED SEQUENCE 3 [Dendrobium catenatum]